MKLPSKYITYKDSSFSKIPYFLHELEVSDLTVYDLYKKVKNKVEGVKEFVDVLDILYALNKVELIEEVLHYVKRN